MWQKIKRLKNVAKEKMRYNRTSTLKGEGLNNEEIHLFKFRAFLNANCSKSAFLMAWSSCVTEWCVMSQIIERYQQAAISFRIPKKIWDKCQNLFKLYWKDIRKQKDYTGDVKKRKAFIKNQLQASFSAFCQDEDIAFFIDQLKHGPGHPRCPV